MTSKFQKLRDNYFQYYKHFPHIITFVPGRANLIGEHLDHQDFPVLPITLSQSTRIAIGVLGVTESLHPGVLEIRHTKPQKYPSVKFNTYSTLHFEETSSPGSWVNYIVAAYLGILEYYSLGCDINKVGSTLLFDKCFLSDKMVSVAEKLFSDYVCHILVDGDLPIAAGLSSSSSLLVSAAIAFLFTLQSIHSSKEQNKTLTIDGNSITFNLPSRYQLAQLAVQCEHYLGVFGGGMDQASILLGLPGKASLVEFKPLKIDYIPLVSEGVFVISDTCIESCKAKTAAEFYNKRIFELKIGAYLMLKAILNEQSQFYQSNTLLSLNLKYVYDQFKEGTTIQDAIAFACDTIPDGELTKNQVEELIGADVIEFILQHCVGTQVWEKNSVFEPLKRVLHVYNEVERVYKFASICKSTTMIPEQQLNLLGKIMNESQSSLRELYDCSSTEIEYMTSLAREFGAYGSRLTGAGWGGCVISLVKTDSAAAFIEQMKTYYETKFDSKDKFPKPLKELIFEVKPTITATISNGITFKEILWC